MKKGIVLTMAMLSMGVSLNAQWLNSPSYTDGIIPANPAITNSIYRWSRVGINTPTPFAQLQIVNDNNAEYRNLGTCLLLTGTLGDRKNTPGAPGLVFEDNAGGDGAAITHWQNKLYFYKKPAGTINTSTWDYAAGDLAMVIDGQRQVGIGTASPQNLFHVNGGVRISSLPSNIATDRLVFATTSGDLRSLSPGTTSQFLRGDGTWATVTTGGGITNSCSTVNFLTKTTATNGNIGCSQIFDDGTNVGIGTTSPQGLLHLVNTTGIPYRNLGVCQLQTGDAANGAGLMLENTLGGSAAAITMGLPGDNNMYIFRNTGQNSGNFLMSDVKVTIDGNGSVGIGTSSGFTYTSLSNALLGTTVPPSSGTVKFEVNGMSRSLAHIVTSDRNLKMNIKPLPNSLKIINSLEGKTYQWNEQVQKERGADNGLHIGFIAQELQKVIPEVVITDQDGELGVNYNEIIPILTEAIKEQQKQIDAQSAQIEELKKLVIAQNRSGDGNAAILNKINVELSDKNVIVLGQNVPNPFSEFTTIEYNIPEDVKAAQVNFTTVDGKALKAIQITQKGKGVVNVYASELKNGVYIYSLIVDGKLIESKRMEVLQ